MVGAEDSRSANAVLKPPPGVRHEWWIYTRLADEMGVRLFDNRLASAAAKLAARATHTPLGRLLRVPERLIDGMLRRGGLPGTKAMSRDHPHGLLLPEQSGDDFLGTDRVLTSDGRVDLAPAAFASAFEQRVKVVLRLTNPNNRDLAIEGLRFSLELNEEPFTRGVSDQHVTVPRLGEETVEVIATTSVIDLLRQLQVLTRRQDLDFPYRLEGRIFLDDSLRSLDFERSGRLGR